MKLSDYGEVLKIYRIHHPSPVLLDFDVEPEDVLFYWFIFSDKIVVVFKDYEYKFIELISYNEAVGMFSNDGINYISRDEELDCIYDSSKTQTDAEQAKSYLLFDFKDIEFEPSRDYRSCGEPSPWDLGDNKIMDIINSVFGKS